MSKIQPVILHPCIGRDKQMSTMDSELCWGERSQNDEHDCGPDSGMVLPKVYSLDPAQVLKLYEITYGNRRPKLPNRSVFTHATP